MMPIITGGYSCRDIVDNSSAFIDRELSWSEWARFRMHLLTCPPCARYVAQMGITVDKLRNMRGAEGRHMRSELLDLFDDWSSGRLDDEEGPEE